MSEKYNAQVSNIQINLSTYTDNRTITFDFKIGLATGTIIKFNFNEIIYCKLADILGTTNILDWLGRYVVLDFDRGKVVSISHLMHGSLYRINKDEFV